MYENNNQYPNEYSNEYTDSYGTSSNGSYQNSRSTITATVVDEPIKKDKKKNGFGKRLVKSAISGAVFGIFAALVMLVIFDTFPSENNAVQEVTTQNDGGDSVKQEVNKVGTVNTSTNSSVTTDLTQVVDDVMPSVVSITGMYRVENDLGPFGSYFGIPSESEEQGSGSGIIVGENEDELLVVTNNHVVQDSTSLSVQFIDGTSVDATVKGTDNTIDLAVIAINLNDIEEETLNKISVAKLGDSDALKVGETAIAIGNALGYGQSVTAGVVSATHRENISEDGNISYLIQTDAAINPGNSGGALLNINGEVIGINVSKIYGSVIEGMGYAIPISTAQPIIEELMTKKTKVKVDEGEQKAYLGIKGIAVTEEVQNAYGLPLGVYIGYVEENSPAEKAGLVKGDIITTFDGEKVDSQEELADLLFYYTKGSVVELTIMQGSPSGYQEKSVTVTLGGRVDS